MSGTFRSDIALGMWVDIVLKKDQRTGILTRGRVHRILTKSAEHHRGIKVMLIEKERGTDSHLVGRVQHILTNEEVKEQMRIFYTEMLSRSLFILIDKTGAPFVFNHYNSIDERDERTILLFEERVDFELFILPTHLSRGNYKIVEIDKFDLQRLFTSDIPDYFRINGERKVQGKGLLNLIK